MTDIGVIRPDRADVLTGDPAAPLIGARLRLGRSPPPASGAAAADALT